MKVYVIVQVTEEEYQHFRAVCKTKEEADELVTKMFCPEDHKLKVLEQDTKIWHTYLYDNMRSFFAKCDEDDMKVSITETDLEDSDYYSGDVKYHNGMYTMHIIARSFSEAEKIFNDAVDKVYKPNKSKKVSKIRDIDDLPEYVG